MKAKLIFDFSKPGDDLIYRRTNKALDLSLAIFDILQIRRELTKEWESKEELNDEYINGVNRFSEEIKNILEAYNINIDDLIE